jgi:hypothetical protein
MAQSGWERLSADETRILTISADIPGMDESTDASVFTSLMERSARNIKDLVESEV